jgi:hypothetical protein
MEDGRWKMEDGLNRRTIKLGGGWFVREPVAQSNMEPKICAYAELTRFYIRQQK